VPDPSTRTSIVNLCLGRPLASDEKEGIKIGVWAAIPAMGLDGLSSSAYGPEAALAILLPAGAAGLNLIGPITFVILALLTMLYFSYRQTIAAYPVNGGSYTVAKENLGTWPGLLAAAALMIDYILNVAVGISAGVGALVSAAPSLERFTVPLCLGILAAITLLNLRGTGEAGLAFALPTYTFILTMAIVLLLGIARAITTGGHPHALIAPPPIAPATAGIGLWLILRTFASGCTAMTGVEAVSNGVSAFRDPTVKNAHRTLTVIVGTLALLLAAIAYLVKAYHIDAMDQATPGYQSVLSQLTSAIVGRGWFYYLTIGSVLAILCLSANTSFVDFPRLSRLIADDDFLPRAFAMEGRRLVYSVGIMFLAAAAAVLLIAFKGITDKLIPLFAVGAFLAFTLSQAGMVMHWHKKGGGGRIWINGLGAIATGGALVIILMAKFLEGAWITVLAIPTMLIVFYRINRHYRKIDADTRKRQPMNLDDNPRPVVLVPMRRWDRLSEKALRFSMWLSTDVIAVHLSNLSGDEAKQEDQHVRAEWAKEVEAPAKTRGVNPPQLLVLQSPYRSFLDPLLEEIDKLKAQYPDRYVAVVVPEVMETRWWELLLHGHKATHLRAALATRSDKRVLVVTVPWYVE
jgi:amino acid transporter